VPVPAPSFGLRSCSFGLVWLVRARSVVCLFVSVPATSFGLHSCPFGCVLVCAGPHYLVWASFVLVWLVRLCPRYLVALVWSSFVLVRPHLA
jgi:hypothetical protein